MGAWLERPKALLLDLDNTLYDWVAFFGPALRGMCRTLSEMTGLPLRTIFDEFKAVFAEHGTVEYSFALQELPSLRAMHPSDSAIDIVERYRPVIDVFQHRRRQYLRPYEGVPHGIELLHQAGYWVFGVTDSRRFQAENRLRQVRLDRLLDGLCCVPDHKTPDDDTVAAIRRRSADHYTSALTRVMLLPDGVRKPSPKVLHFAISSLSLDYEACIYAGDSLAKDVSMAQQAGVYDCWAEYGALVSPLDLATLVRVTDWPRRAVEDALSPSPDRLGIFPSYTARSFDDVVSLALLEPDERPRRHRVEDSAMSSPVVECGPRLQTSA